jgi:hypothetical protein
MELRKFDKVRVTKIGVASSPVYRTAGTGEWIPGAENDGVTPPIEYENEGIVRDPPRVGERFLMPRYKRNGVEVTGIFHTSLIKRIIDKDYGCDIHTENSVYRIERLKAKLD